jgi:hypothetical protein
MAGTETVVESSLQSLSITNPPNKDTDIVTMISYSYLRDTQFES